MAAPAGSSGPLGDPARSALSASGVDGAGLRQAARDSRDPLALGSGQAARSPRRQLMEGLSLGVEGYPIPKPELPWWRPGHLGGSQSRQGRRHIAGTCGRRGALGAVSVSRRRQCSECLSAGM